MAGRILATYATCTGSTIGVAEAIGKTLAEGGASVDVLPMQDVKDLAIIPTLVIGGVVLRRRQALGYVVGAGLLFLVSMLFVGLLVYFVLQPLLTGVPFPTDDFLVVAVMSLISFVPFGLFVRGIVIHSGSTSTG